MALEYDWFTKCEAKRHFTNKFGVVRYEPGSSIIDIILPHPRSFIWASRSLRKTLNLQSQHHDEELSCVVLRRVWSLLSSSLGICKDPTALTVYSLDLNKAEDRATVWHGITGMALDTKSTVRSYSTKYARIEDNTALVPKFTGSRNQNAHEWKDIFEKVESRLGISSSGKLLDFRCFLAETAGEWADEEDAEVTALERKRWP